MNLENCCTEDLINEIIKRNEGDIGNCENYISSDENKETIYKLYENKKFKVVLLKKTSENEASLSRIEDVEPVENTMTKSQEKVYMVIKDFIETHGYSPTIRELCDITGRRSTCTMHGIVKRLKEKGFIENKSEAPRTLKIKKIVNLNN